ncbi:hypothetical protein GCM10017687_50160 [Streptomyces echinatus]
MARPRLRTQIQGGGVVQDSGEGGGGDLADAVARDRARGDLGDVTECRGGQETGGDQQRLGHGGVTDGVGVGLGAVVDKIQADGVRPCGDAVRGTGQFEPGSQEAGRLGALAGSDEYEHSHTLSWGRARPPVRTGTKNTKGFCGPPTKPYAWASPSARRPRMRAIRSVNADRTSDGDQPVTSVTRRSR